MNYTKFIFEVKYYNIINGYKDFFIDKQASKVKNEDVFENGTKFEHISALYDFDTEIRLLFLKNILKMENILKTKIAYFFSKSYNNQDFNYLNINNYNDTKKGNEAFYHGFIIAHRRENRNNSGRHILNCLKAALAERVGALRERHKSYLRFAEGFDAAGAAPGYVSQFKLLGLLGKRCI